MPLCNSITLCWVDLVFCFYFPFCIFLCCVLYHTSEKQFHHFVLGVNIDSQLATRAR